MLKKIRLEKGYLVLTLCILIIGFFIFKDFFLLKNVYIYNDIGSDTNNSYWPYLTYLSNMIYSGDFSLWSFNIGIGTSMFSTNPILTDPFNILAALWGPHLLVYILPYIALLKILTAAIGFYTYLKYIGMSRYSSLISSLLYGFNGFVILWGQHYHMGTIIVFIPFVLLGFERWMKEKKICLYVISLFLIAFSSYYFLYMFAIFFIMYVLVRYFEEYTFQFKHFVVFLLKNALYSILAIGLSCFILLPSVYVALNNPRISGQFIGNNIFSFATVMDYLTIIFRLFSNDILGTGTQFYGLWNYYEAPILYTGTISLLLVPLFFVYANRKNRIIYGTLFFFLFLFLVFPFFSQFLNAFSANSYRWTFIIIVFVCILNAKTLNYISEIKLKSNNLLLFLLFLTIMFISIISLLVGDDLLNWSQFFTHSFKYLFISLLLLLMYCFVIKMMNNRIYKKVILILICIELAVFSSITVNRVMLSKESINSKTGYNDYTKEALNYINEKDNGFFRIDKSYNSVFLADAMSQGYKGLKSYNSLNQPSYVEFLRNMGVPFKILNHPNYLTGLDSNTDLSRLLGVRYLLINNEAFAPNGYELVNEIENVKIYEDKYALPLGFAYERVISYEEFMKYNAEIRSNILLKSFVSKENMTEINKYDNLDLSGIDNSIVLLTMPIDKQNIGLLNIDSVNGELANSLTFNAINNDPQIILPLIKGESPSQEIKVSMHITSSIASEGQLFFGGDNGFSEENSKTFNYGVGETFYEFTFDYSNVSQLRLDISNAPGLFTISDFKIQFVDNKSLNDIESLKKNSLSISKYSNDYIRGSIETDSPKKLFMSIPFDKGWSAKVNGEKVGISNINLGFIGIDLFAGKNMVELSYTPPLLITGSVISFISLLFLLAIIFLKKRKSKRSN